MSGCASKCAWHVCVCACLHGCVSVGVSACIACCMNVTNACYCACIHVHVGAHTHTTCKSHDVCQQQLTRDSDDEQEHPLQEGHSQKTVAQAL